MSIPKMMHQKYLTFLSISLCVLTLCACAPKLPLPQSMMNAQDAMAMAKASSGDDQNNYLLTAAQNYVNSHEISLAAHALSLMPMPSLTPAEYIQYNLIQAAIYLDEKKYAAVIALLTSSDFNNPLADDQNLNRKLLLAKAYDGEDNPSQALSYFSQCYAPSSANNQEISLSIWRILQTMSLTTLSQLAHDKTLSSSETSIEQGWISLAILYNQDNQAEHLADYKQAISQWITTYPDHPALALIDQKQLQNSMSAPKHITLLLPLTGPFAKSGEAIRNAFFAAYYQDRSHSQSAPSISVEDTYQNSVQDLYQQAVANGSDYIVGPLLKNNVDAIASLSQLSIPVLALNSPTITQTKPNFYSFSLSPVQEATATAQRAFAQNHAPHAVMIIPNNDWGSHIGQAFQTQWQQLGGQVLSSVTYQSRNDLYQSIKKLLELDLSQNRIHNVENTLGKKVRATPVIRQDMDCIFIVAETSMARQIAPLLKFYYAGNIPTYSISTIYDGTPGTAADNDMNGLIFSDMPFVLLKNLPQTYPYWNIKNQLQTLYPKSFAENSKLYALGLDAYLLTQEMPKLAITPLLGLTGATGQLTINADQSINRQVLWVQMINGSPKLLQN